MYEAFSRRGERFTPHAYEDGLYRCAVYKPNDKAWKNKENYLAIDASKLSWALKQPNFYIRMRGDLSEQVNFFSVASLRAASTAAP